jgi:hypothetical protein
MLGYGHQDPLLCFLESVVAEEVGGGDSGSGDSTTCDLQTRLEAVLITSLEQPVSFLNFFFYSRKQHFQSWYDYPQVLDYQDF